MITVDPQQDVWLTRDRREVRICEMTDDHLINTLAMLKRNALDLKEEQVEESWRWTIASGDTASEDGDAASEEMSRSNWTRWGHRMWVPLFKDALRRGGDVAQRAVDLL